MKQFLIYLCAALAAHPLLQACEQCSSFKGPDFVIKQAAGRYDAAIDSIVLDVSVEAGRATPGRNPSANSTELQFSAMCFPPR